MENKKIKKIILIGPVYPFKGGIAHYTGAMYNALKKEYYVEMVSFKLQYPYLLYKKQQKDYSNKTLQIENTKYIINTINPLSWFRTANHIRKMKPDLVITQWWHPYFSPCYWVMMKLMKSIKKIFICHNVFPHESFLFDRLLTKMVLQSGDGFVVQSSLDAQDLKSIIKQPKYRKSVHPTYNSFKFKDMDKITARKQLNLLKDEKIILFFGFIREYKGLKYLISALPDVIKSYSDIKLLIVGEFGNSKQEYLKLIHDNQVENWINIYDGYIPDTEIEQYFAASDLVVLPYVSATQSGIVQMAYGFEKPVLVTEVGGLPEVVIDNKTGYVVKPQDSKAIAEAIKRFYSEDKETEFVNGVKEEAYRYSWDRMTEVVTELYREL